jgi:hypothetical protein
MATRKVILTERELTSLIKRIVRETKETGMDMDMDFENEDNEITRKEAISLIADFFKQEVLPELTPSEKRKLKTKVSDTSPRSLGESYLDEEDEDKNIDDRRSSFREKLMMRGGGALAASGLIGVIGSSMGWSEFETTTKIHEFIEMSGLGNYDGPITVAMIAAGLVLAFKGRDEKYKRTGE